MIAAAALALALARQGEAPEPPRLPLRFGGRIHADYSLAGPASATSAIGAARGEAVEDGGEIRRARLRADWVFDEAWRFRADFDLARGDTVPREAALAWRPADGAEWKAGFAKPPFGFEKLMSSNDFDLAGDSLYSQAVPPHRGMGLFYSSWDERLTLAGAAYLLADARARAERGSWGATARAAWRPWRGSGGDLLHLAAAWTWEDPDEAHLSFGADPAHHVLGEFLDSGPFTSGGFARCGLEAACVQGPWFGLLEAGAALPDDGVGGTGVASAWAATVGAFLTGERRAYDQSKACWGGTAPLSPFDPADPGAGSGAWELAARAERLDLGELTGGGPGEMRVWSAGVVWHWTPHLRWLLTASRVELDGFDALGVASLRMSFDF